MDYQSLIHHKKRIVHVGMHMVSLILAKSGVGHCPCPLNIPKTSDPQEISLITLVV
jgi:hypothetical protein